MAGITHRQARALMQAEADRRLSSPQQALLSVHLAGCRDCRDHARALSQLQEDLRTLTRHQWDGVRPGLSIRTIQDRLPAAKAAARREFSGLVFKLAAIGALALVFASTTGWVAPLHFGTPDAFAQPSVAAVQAPRPPASIASTRVLATTCAEVLHLVQQNDSFESIATQYSISKETLMEYNQLEDVRIRPGDLLIVPVCSGASSGTAFTPANTTGTTPVGSTRTSTPNE